MTSQTGSLCFKTSSERLRDFCNGLEPRPRTSASDCTKMGHDNGENEAFNFMGS